MKRCLYALLFVIAFPFVGSAQVVVTSANGQSAEQLVNQYFAGGGVVISNVKFNGQTTINSNQIGTFTNANTASPNVPISAGIVMTTSDCQDAAAGVSDNIETSTASPALNGGSASPALLRELQSRGFSSNHMHEVAVLQFDFIPSGDQVSFKYSFASEEYPAFVCTQYNDAFGFFITGPFDENGNPVNEPGFPSYPYRNIAVIPGTTEPVTINAAFGGETETTPCSLANDEYRIENTNNNCKMNGYTLEFETERVLVAPCRMYKMELAICNISDGSYESAVFLSANSFKMDEFTLSEPVATPGVENPFRFTKGCSHYDLNMYINRPATESETHNLVIDGTAVEGVDYTLTDANGAPAGSMLTFNEGDTSAMVRINFIASDTDVPGEIRTLRIITEEVNDCAERDTLILELVTPEAMTHTLQRQTQEGWVEITDDIVYCGDVLPLSERMKAEVEGAVGNITYEWSMGNHANEAENLVEVVEPMSVFLTISDECSRTILDTVTFKVNTATTTASADKDGICVGDAVTLSTEEAVEYLWTSEPYDATLENNANVREPEVSPEVTTVYTVEITDEYTCKAWASVQVKVVPSVKAAMRLTPTRTTIADPNIEFQDLTVGSVAREWDFGDGQTSILEQGVVSYSNADTATYEVRLIAFNAANCPDTTYGSVQVTPEFTLWIPNTFTPESDNVNALFGPVFGAKTEYELSIFSRNGDRIFVSSEEHPKWDGRVNGGDIAPDGVYIWVLMYNQEGLLKRKTGTVNLMMH